MPYRAKLLLYCSGNRERNVYSALLADIELNRLVEILTADSLSCSIDDFTLIENDNFGTGCTYVNRDNALSGISACADKSSNRTVHRIALSYTGVIQDTEYFLFLLGNQV